MSLVTLLAKRLLHLPPASHPRLVEQADLPMTTADGVTLLAHRWVPRGFEHGGLPTLFMRSPYGRRGVMAFEAPLLASFGYNVVIQSTRGTYGSGGDFYPFADEQPDGVEALRWVRSQNWCDGALATIGGSYCGYTQLASLAGETAEAVDAMAVAVTSTDLRVLFQPYGAFSLLSANSWVYGLDPQGLRSPLASIRHMLGGHAQRRQALTHLPMREADVVLTGTPHVFYRDWVDADASYWDRFDIHSSLSASNSPISVYAGWFDIFLPGQLSDATQLFASARDVRLVIGPWDHAHGAGSRFRHTLRFFDETLRGSPPGMDPRPVRMMLHGDNRWWAFPSWPLNTTPQAWHLTAELTLTQTAAIDDGLISWSDDPSNPPPVSGGAVLQGGGPKDNAAREARDDVIVFTSAPLEHDVVIVGSPRFTGQTYADVPSYDVAVRLCVVDEKGVSRNLSDGLQRVRANAADVSVSMWPVGARLRRGERIRLQVAGSLHPMWARNLHTGHVPATATASAVAKQSLVLGPHNPATLELPTIALSDADLAADDLI